MIKQGKTIVHTGHFTTWDGSNITEVMDIAGDKFVELDNEVVFIRIGDDSNQVAPLHTGQMIARFGDLVITYGGDLGPKMVEAVPDAE